ncbi:MAG TPA: hypothetical protein VGN01_01900 [Acidobacteriaceae bacterium]
MDDRYGDPKKTIKLLEDLALSGFDNADFKRVHHMPSATITAHIRYCMTVKKFQAKSENRQVQMRLHREWDKRKSP